MVGGGGQKDKSIARKKCKVTLWEYNWSGQYRCHAERNMILKVVVLGTPLYLAADRHTDRHRQACIS